MKNFLTVMAGVVLFSLCSRNTDKLRDVAPLLLSTPSETVENTGLNTYPNDSNPGGPSNTNPGPSGVTGLSYVAWDNSPAFGTYTLPSTGTWIIYVHGAVQATGTGYAQIGINYTGCIYLESTASVVNLISTGHVVINGDRFTISNSSTGTSSASIKEMIAVRIK